MSFNHVSVLGTVYKVMPAKTLENGATVLGFTLDVDDTYTNKEGNNIPRSFKIDGELWGSLVGKYLNDIIQGNLVLVEGSLKLASWDEPNGVKKYKHLITVKQVVGFSDPSDKEKVIHQREAVLYQDNPF